MSAIRKPVIATLTLTFAISQPGCTQLEKFSDSKSAQYSVQGCLAGGTAAGVVTYVVNWNDENARKKALIASALGCMAGAVIGFKIGERTEEYANATQAAEAETARNKDTVDRLHQYNASLEVNINDYKKQIQNIKDTKMTAQEKQDSLKKTKKIVSDQQAKAKEAVTETEQELNKTREQYAKYKRSLNSAEASGWQEEIASLEQEKLILSRHVNTLNALDASI